MRNYPAFLCILQNNSWPFPSHCVPSDLQLESCFHRLRFQCIATKSNAAVQAWTFQPPTSKTFDDGALTNKTFEQEKATLEKDTEIHHQTTLNYGLNPTKTQSNKELVSLGKAHS